MKYQKQKKAVLTLLAGVALIASTNVGATHIAQPCDNRYGNMENNPFGNPQKAIVGQTVTFSLSAVLAETDARAAWTIRNDKSTMCEGSWAYNHPPAGSPPSLVVVGGPQCSGNPTQKVTFTTPGKYRVYASYAPADLSLTYCRYVLNSFEVEVSPAPPTVTLSANPTSIRPGASSTLTWSSANATSCTGAGGWNQNLAISGSMAVTPASTTTYSISCTGPGGTSLVKSATVTVIPVQNWLVPILNFLLGG